MNYNVLTYRELVHYLDFNSTDPVVRKLVSMLTDGPNDMFAGLVEAGMDPRTGVFSSGYRDMTPGEYIQDLEAEVRQLNESNDDLQCRLEWAEDERDQLKTRNIVDFIEEVQAEKRANQDLVRESIATVQAYKKENDKLKEQIDMWGRMNRVHS